ncbi:hypothetical protein, partial [Bacteroides acidifaciens]
ALIILFKLNFLHIFDYVYLHWFGSLNIHKSSLISADRENFFFGGDFLVSPSEGKSQNTHRGIAGLVGESAEGVSSRKNTSIS